MDRQQTWDMALRALAKHGVEPTEELRQQIADAFFTGVAPFRVAPIAHEVAGHFLVRITVMVSNTLDSACGEARK